jgi:isoleucyl-tRNA synthetase
VVRDVTDMYNKFKLPEVVQLLEDFLIKDLSKTYIQMIRDRSSEVRNILQEIYLGTLKLFAPIVSFTTEDIWQSLKQKEESIHLTEFPKVNKKMINNKLEESFAAVSQVIEKGLAERDKVKIGLKWPLAKAIATSSVSFNTNLKELIAKQLNIKKLEVKKAKSFSVKLNTKMTPELEAEGYARNMIRSIQAFRKKLGLKPVDKVKTVIICSKKLKEMLEKHKKLVADRTNSKELEIDTKAKETFKNKIDFKVKNEGGELGITA